MQTAPQTATKRRAAAKSTPALMPLPDHANPNFWPIHALNCDAKLQALDAMLDNLYTKNSGGSSGSTHTKKMALIAATVAMCWERDNAFDSALRGGHLLFTWRGNRALVAAPTSNQQGSAA